MESGKPRDPARDPIVQVMSGVMLLAFGVVLVTLGTVSKHGILRTWGVFGGIWAIGFGYVLFGAGYSVYREHYRDNCIRKAERREANQ